ncbi:tail fiber protein [Massilia aurea]|uniref:phage tail protein n=1 Tax=Massilia aurea TaxID=373040 RepID=UPI00346292AE
MGSPYIGEIRMVSFTFPPKGWAFCNGQLLPINQNQALFALLGTTYGGNGQTTFALPDLRGRAPVHAGASSPRGLAGGSETHVLTQNELPPHAHAMVTGAAVASSTSPANALPGKKAPPGRYLYAAPGNLTTLNSASVTQAGGSQPHQNMQPFMALNFLIALSGIFPSQT